MALFAGEIDFVDWYDVCDPTFLPSPDAAAQWAWLPRLASRDDYHRLELVYYYVIITHVLYAVIVSMILIGAIVSLCFYRSYVVVLC